MTLEEVFIKLWDLKEYYKAQGHEMVDIEWFPDVRKLVKQFQEIWFETPNATARCVEVLKKNLDRHR